MGEVIDMNWTVDINIIIQILSLAAIAGMGWQKLQQIEKDVARLEKEIFDFRDLRSDLMVIKTHVFNLASKIDTMIGSKHKED